MTKENFLRGTTIPSNSIPDVNGVPFEDVWNEYFKDLFTYHDNNSTSPELSINFMLSRPVEADYSSSGVLSISYFESSYSIKLFKLKRGAEYLAYIVTDSEGFEEISEHPDVIAVSENEYLNSVTVFFDTGISKEVGEKFDEAKNLASRVRELEIELGYVNNDKYPAWSILKDKDSRTSIGVNFIKNSSMISSNKARIARNENHLEKIQSILSDALNGIEISKERYEDFNKLIYEFDRSINMNSLYTGYIADRPKKLESIEFFLGMLKEAEALPEDSSIRKYLLTDRGQGFYNSTEGKGRGKRTVVKSYDKGSVLSKKIEESERDLKSNNHYFDAAIDKLKKAEEIIKNKIQDLNASIAIEISLSLNSLKEDWPGSDEEFNEFMLKYSDVTLEMLEK